MEHVKKFLHVESVIGQGAFGQVLLTQPNPPQNKIYYALKCVHPVSKPQRLCNELRLLRDLGGTSNVVKMHTAHFHDGCLFIVMDFISHEKFTNYVAKLEYNEIILYMKNLLIALEHIHRNNVVHRDIKPANFLYDRTGKKFLLVDFGLAQTVRTASVPTTPTLKRLVHTPEPQILKKFKVSKEFCTLTLGVYESPVTCDDKFSTPRVPPRRRNNRCGCRGKARTCESCIGRPEPNAPKSGTPGFKAPEVLLRSPNQSQAIDIWSAGHIFACLLSGHTPFFRDVDDGLSLAEIMTISGSKKVIDAARKIGINLLVQPPQKPCDLARLCTAIRMSNKEKLQFTIPREAFDLLEAMLDPNPMTRITASDALRHPWFYQNPVC